MLDGFEKSLSHMLHLTPVFFFIEYSLLGFLGQLFLICLFILLRRENPSPHLLHFMLQTSIGFGAVVILDLTTFDVTFGLIWFGADRWFGLVLIGGTSVVDDISLTGEVDGLSRIGLIRLILGNSCNIYLCSLRTL